ncbi:nuclear transport factor 2 family protein [Novosphingobium sp. KCTC 2891]|uniref:nuclear transport factor 2 family protein n=1 Tax=Novosphingobium sp. KCTC 2891 TaxID=2989730 RepID=UPI0022233D23|nr:nuclear transport factor 2 family protein [Novosphingobium sp. KCTC 2891]MCW1384488.1 nuclear transport factor 2 family protein [Novosphingobium sp. KCTC 2891]
MSVVRPDQVADRLAIADLLCRYARGIDRCDEGVLRAVWWPEAKADYGSGEVDALAWSGDVVTALSAMRRTQHFLGNMIIEIDGTSAEAETYCRAWHEVDSADGPQEMEVGGRYLDRLERRGDEWRILHRRYVLDWSRNGPSTARWDGPLYDGLRRRGARAPHDPSMTGE